jgi:hypothetical protein
MTDRKLLEYAAKAAGIDLSAGFSLRLNAFYVEPKEETGAYAGWNPLTDDGDALRLAVKLKIELEFGSNFVNTGHCLNPGRWHLAQEKLSDPYAATRRAIVRAAAEIGKNKP